MASVERQILPLTGEVSAQPTEGEVGQRIAVFPLRPPAASPFGGRI